MLTAQRIEKNMSNALENIKKTVDDIKTLKIQVGVFDPDIAWYAAEHELGNPLKKLPERSFLRLTTLLQRDYIMTRLTQHRDEILKKFTAGEGAAISVIVGQIGVEAVGETFKQRGQGWAPLKPRTVARKGHDVPLLLTGDLRHSIDFRVI